MLLWMLSSGLDLFQSLSEKDGEVVEVKSMGKVSRGVVFVEAENSLGNVILLENGDGVDVRGFRLETSDIAISGSKVSEDENLVASLDPIVIRGVVVDWESVISLADKEVCPVIIWGCVVVDCIFWFVVDSTDWFVEGWDRVGDVDVKVCKTVDLVGSSVNLSKLFVVVNFRESQICLSHHHVSWWHTDYPL